jgi:hypothetical protein
MIKIISILFTLVLTSLYLFPFELTVLPGVNTKMMMAVLGGAILLCRLAQKRSLILRSDMLQLLFAASLVSLAGLVSIVYNATPDIAYASYVISMLVWLAAAYAVCSIIEIVHGQCTLRLLCTYLFMVCVVQCALALLIDAYPPFKQLVDAHIQQGQYFLNLSKVHRLYGIGASLDVAGTRFSVVLIMIMFLLVNPKYAKRWYHYLLYILSFIFISVVGNIIARTTMVGLSLALIYMAGVTFTHFRNLTSNYLYSWRWVLPVLLICITVVVFVYKVSPSFKRDMRFGFEGFFALAEKGHWEVTSNETLKSMYVYPKSTKTWIIGDGYFSNPRDVDANFVGKITGGYYMGTDVGYLRFIFYFGVVGLIAFMSFLVTAARCCMRLFDDDKLLILLFLLVNFIIWFKVSTDIFLIFALFLCAGWKLKSE